MIGSAIEILVFEDIKINNVSEFPVSLMKKFLVMFISFLSPIFSIFSAEFVRKPIYFDVVPFLGHIKSEMVYPDLARTVVTNLLYGRWDTYSRLGHRLLPEYIMASTGDGSGRATLWFGLNVWSEEPFDPSDLKIVIKSSDQGNIFGKTEEFGSQSYIYTPTSSVGIREDGTMVTSGNWSTEKVVAFAFVGTACSTMMANNQAETDNNEAWLRQQGNFSITATFSINYGGKTYASSYQMQMHPTPASARMVLSGGSYKVAISGEPWDWVYLEKNTNLSSGLWQLIAIARGGDMIPIDPRDRYAFYRTKGP